MNPRPSAMSRLGTGIAIAAVLIFTLFPVYWMVSSAVSYTHLTLPTKA